MGPARLDRAELRRRLAGEAPDWMLDELADAFEASAMASMKFASERRREDEDKANRHRAARAEE
jgi:hypothetical protein